MTTESMHYWQRWSGSGVGGWRCQCCGPAPKDRPAARRRAKRRLRQRERREIAAELENFDAHRT